MQNVCNPISIYTGDGNGETQMLNKEYEYFSSIRDKLIKENFGEYAVIWGEEVLGFYKTEDDALLAMKDIELGTFLIQQCVPEEESIQKYHSRAVFA